jgi:dTDP-4-amino-4,6-dideoxygalactose transaminase
MYWIPQSLPFLHLGDTRYKPLSSIDTMDSVRRGLLAVNIDNYQQDSATAQAALASLMQEPGIAGKGLVNLPAVCTVPRRQRLLRYPLLVDPNWRESIYQRLRHAGLGASMMYPASLPAIPGMEGMLESQGPFPVADNFARRLLTLPTHGRVCSGDISKIRQAFRSRHE